MRSLPRIAPLPGSLVSCWDMILIASAAAVQSRAERGWWKPAARGAYLMLQLHVTLFNELTCVARRLLHALGRAQAEISLDQVVAWRTDPKRPAWASWQAQRCGGAA